MLSEQFSRKIAAIKEENSLSGLLNQLSEGLLPGVHLDHFHPVADLVHQPDPPVRREAVVTRTSANLLPTQAAIMIDDIIIVNLTIIYIY